MPAVSLVGTEGMGDNNIALNLATSRGLSEPEVLEAMAEQLERRGTIVDALALAVVTEIRRQGIAEGGPQLVTALVPTLLRGMDNGFAVLDDEVFAGIHGRSRTPLEKATAGGDWALHRSVGFGLEYGERRLSTRNSRVREYRPIAEKNYETARKLAEKPNRGEEQFARTVRATAPTLANHFGNAVNVISGMLRRRDTVAEILTDRGVRIPDFTDFSGFEDMNCGRS